MQSLKTERNWSLSYPVLCSDVSHTIALGGGGTSGNLCDLLRFRIEAGDKVLKDHMEVESKHASYTSVREQNELIVLSKEVVGYNIVKTANELNELSIIADETADISGIE